MKKEKQGTEGCSEELTEKEFDKQTAETQRRWAFWLDKREQDKKRRARK